MQITTTKPLKTEQSHKRVRAFHQGKLLFDTTEPVLVWEWEYYPQYYIHPRDVIDPSLAKKHVVDLDGKPTDLLRFEFKELDQWFEEEEPIYVHPRDPYKRVDILSSSRHVIASLEGVKFAESTQPRLLFETSLPVRYYLPLANFDMSLLKPSAKNTTSQCPYKGTAEYFDLHINGKSYDDFIWIYRNTLPESQKVVGMASFYNEKVDLVVDGIKQDRPKTHFS